MELRECVARATRRTRRRGRAIRRCSPRPRMNGITQRCCGLWTKSRNTPVRLGTDASWHWPETEKFSQRLKERWKDGYWRPIVGQGDLATILYSCCRNMDRRWQKLIQQSDWRSAIEEGRSETS